ncbi:hypothetical protein Tco_0598169 [Tanacetum coccineum]
MSTSKTYQQSLADAGSETRPPMLERGSYILWASRFRRYINRKRENQKFLNKSALIKAKDMWKRVESLMRGTKQNKVDRETCFVTHELDHFGCWKPGEALVLLFTIDEAGVILTDEQNDFLFADASWMEEIEGTKFSKESTLSKSLDTTYVFSKPKIDVGGTSKVNDKVVQIVLWIVDSGCSKHMMVDRSLLKNFIEKFIGTVRFGNDNFVGQFCDGNLEVAFRSKTCYMRNLEEDDLLIGDRESNLYTISISDMAASLPVCLMSKA